MRSLLGSAASLVAAVWLLHPVGVLSAGEGERRSFLNEVVPLLTRLGCNQGACHGKNAGQNGFRLSLRGYAPELDHGWIVREAAGRRISLLEPEESLLYRKAAGHVPHGGGKLIEPRSREEELLLRWLAAGAPGPQMEEARPVALEVLPGARLAKVGDEEQLIVRARFSDDHWEDVTWLSTFASNDAGMLEVTAAGLVRVLRPGETAIRVHFQDLVEAVTFTVPYGHEVPAERLAERNNFIDEHVFNKLAALGVPPSGLSSDEEFLRRAYLDTIGRLPTADEVREFLADGRPNKRAEVIDRLLERPEFADYWALELADLLQNRKERDHDVRGTKGVRAFHRWLREQIAANRPWDELARDVLLATGKSNENPQIGYYIVTIGEKRQVEQSEVGASVAQAFLGTRIGCAQCHNHPLEKYTQDDYYHFAAFFARTSLKRQQPEKGPTELVVASPQEAQLLQRLAETRQRLAEAADEQKQAEQQKALESLQKQLEEARAQPIAVTQPRTGAALAPRPLDRSPVELAPGGDPRQALVDWMTSPENESFRGAMVNRLWRHFLGVGLVEPVDDLRATNPPSNAALWQALGEEFVAHDFDLKHLMRVILNSRTYQLSSATLEKNAADSRFYSHYYARRLPAEVLLDAISQATAVPDEFPGYPVGLRAVQVPDPGLESYFLTLFGRSSRTTACACERAGEVTLPQLLHLQNGEVVVAKLAAPEGRLAGLLKSFSDNRAVADELFLSTLGRFPSADEWAAVEAALAAGDPREEVFRDLFWALLNSKEFAFNH